MPAKGQTCLYRPVPPGFDDLFIAVGWGEIEVATNAHVNTIVKWIDLRNAERVAAGMMTLKEARAYKVRQEGRALHPKLAVEARPRSAAARYVIGRTRRPIRWPNPAPRFWDFGLIPGVAAIPERKHRTTRISALKAALMIEAQAAVFPPEVRAGMLKAAELLRAQVGGER